MQNNKTSYCKDLIDKFLLSSDKELKLIFQHIGKVNLDEATGTYNSINCNFNKNDLKYLNDNGKRCKMKTFNTTIYTTTNYGMYIENDIPSMCIYTSK